MCHLLEVSKSGFYSWVASGSHQISPKKSKIQEDVKRVFEEKKGRYGSPRIWRELKNKGINYSKYSMELAMKELGLKAKKKKRFKSTTDSNHNLDVAPNLLNREFNVKTRNQVWLSDITYIPLPNGNFFYLCVILDMASREVLGWHVDNNMETGLVKKALNNAVGNLGRIPKGTIFHSDRGSQYASKEFKNLLMFYGMIQSMSRRGQCWDNAPMESFFGTLKDEYDVAEWCWFETLEEARSGLFEFIEIFYNRDRMHSSIDYQTPSSYK